MRRYAAVLLDVDGTLVDSNDAHAHAWAETFAELDHAVDYSRLRRMIGLGGDRMIESVVGHLDLGHKKLEKIGKRRTEIFRENWLSKVRPLVGARALVLRLRAEGYQYAIASAARADELVPLLELADIADLCERQTTSSDVPASKPDPAAIEAALNCVSVDRTRVVMIGDTPYDIEACSGANVDIIAVTSGGWSHDSLAGAVAVFAGPADLLARWSASPLA
ncbi:MAG: HAD family hydrolase [Deltaproteobacteria bacterium]|nr:HAD family hydrolase [Deltaproteobacteria bacterium]MDQ3296808.1 HAD family hydrolase [Myxococcota bacterium]